MNTSKHTPGPWHATDLRHQKNGQIRIFGNAKHIANILAHNDDAGANARLIAKAPEMLEALKEAASIIGAIGNEYGGCYPILNSLMDLIAKAEGKGET